MYIFKISHWFRALARFCDYSLFFLTLGAIALSLPYFYGAFFYYYLALATPLLWAPVEALFISIWETTPGKALFGLSVRDAQGYKMSYPSALKWSLFLPGRPGTVYQKIVSWKRKFCAFLTAAGFIAAALYGNALALWSAGLGGGIPFGGWVQYCSEDAHFQVSFPSNPESSCKELVIPDSGKVLSYQEIETGKKEKVHYSVSHLELPGKWRIAGNTTLLKGVLKLLVQQQEGSVLVEKEFKMYGAHRVLDYRLQQGNDEIRGRLIIVSGTLYKLTMVYPASQSKELENDPFLNSFTVS